MGKDDIYRKRLLVIRLSALGDVAILEPILRLRAEKNPDVLFLVAAPGLLKPLFDGIENVQFVPTQKKQSPWALFRQLHHLHPHRVADMHHVNRVVVTDWLFRITGTPVVAIRKHDGSDKTSWQRYDEVFDRCGLIASEFCKTISEKDNYWKASPVNGNEIRVGIAPFAQHVGKIWPIEKMEQLISMLSAKGNFHICLFGSKKEAEILESWKDRYPHVESVAGKYSFSEELSLISTLQVMVSMDSANMHFASCLGIPVVSIWGATHPSRGFYGWRQNPEWAVQADMHCRPCSKYGNKPCKLGSYPCLAAVTPDQVLDKIYAVLGL